MQTLFVKTTDGKGKSTMVTVHVVRSWQDASGRQLYLHANGIYGYKDGSPVKNETEFDLIHDAFQRDRAMRWWKNHGKGVSEEFYAGKARDLAELQKDIIVPGAGDNSDLDAVLYRRRLIKDRRRVAFSPPTTWFELFSQRPEWWGVAGIIELGEFRFERAEHGDEPIDEEETEKDPKRGSMDLPADEGKKAGKTGKKATEHGPDFEKGDF